MKERRLHERYHITDGSPKVCAYLQRHSMKQEDPEPVEILDLSIGGIKVRMNEPIAVLSKVRIRISSTALNDDVIAEALVCWARPINNDEWWIGFSMESPIPESTLFELANANCIERRQETRTRIEAQVLVNSVDTKSTRKAILVDISNGGFAIESHTPNALGDTVVVRKASLLSRRNEQVTARVRWCRSIKGDRFRIGCSFTSPGGAEQCHHWVRLAAGASTQSRRERYWKAIASGVGFGK